MTPSQTGRISRRQSRMSLSLVEPDFNELEIVLAPMQKLAKR